MDYEKLIDEMKRCGVATIFLVENTISNLLDLRSDSSSVSNVEDIRSLLDVCLSQPIIDGDASSFHNLSVVLANAQMHHEASEIVKKGLDIYPRSPDLLADFLSYGMNCGRHEECTEIYNTIINELPHEIWTWRVYDFCIDYLFKKIEILATRESIKQDLEDINTLTDEFIEAFSKMELSYYAKSNYGIFTARKRHVNVTFKIVVILHDTCLCTSDFYG